MTLNTLSSSSLIVNTVGPTLDTRNNVVLLSELAISIHSAEGFTTNRFNIFIIPWIISLFIHHYR